MCLILNLTLSDGSWSAREASPWSLSTVSHGVNLESRDTQGCPNVTVTSETVQSLVAGPQFPVVAGTGLLVSCFPSWVQESRAGTKQPTDPVRKDVSSNAPGVLQSKNVRAVRLSSR